MCLDGFEHRTGLKGRQHDHGAAQEQQRDEQGGAGVTQRRADEVRTSSGHCHSDTMICAMVALPR